MVSLMKRMMMKWRVAWKVFKNLLSKVHLKAPGYVEKYDFSSRLCDTQIKKHFSFSLLMNVFTDFFLSSSFFFFYLIISCHNHNSSLFDQKQQKIQSLTMRIQKWSLLHLPANQRKRRRRRRRRRMSKTFKRNVKQFYSTLK